nr:ActS/PrrB/RegB family redox-sensitive histidine kinase [Mangrovicella endophytica]
MRDSQRLRLATLTRLRWLSVAGQVAACVFVAWGLWYPFPVVLCLLLIAVSIAVNVFLTLTYPASRRLSSGAAALVLAFDILQPSGLLFLTGGIENPFAIFLVLPVVVASATQPPLTTACLGILSVIAATLLLFFHLPVPWPADRTLILPRSYVGGLWFAIVATLVLAAIYIYRVAAESRTLADALNATEMVLQREQHLSALDGLAAAAAHELGTPLSTIALVAREMGRVTEADSPYYEDVQLLISQTERCREILRRLTSLSADGEEHLARLPVTSLVEETAEPHRHLGVRIRTEICRLGGKEPVMRRSPGVAYGLGAIVENAADFAKDQVVIQTSWTDRFVTISVSDDGPGFSADALARIGDPYLAYRERGERRGGGGLGLGLFIAKTLLERSGAQISFGNRPSREGSGARVELRWPRDGFDTERTAVHN